MQSQHQRWDPESEVILLRAMPKSFVKQFWNILYMLVSSVCVFSISFRGISFSMLVPRHPKVWQSDFCHRLRIRFQTHHSKCTQCLRHRLIIRKLGHNGPARRAQHQELQNHLARQHSDRKVYWECRSRSRLHSTSLGNLGTFELCGILDSMDAVKYAWPRSQVMSSKLFCNFNRPRMSCTALLLHGHLCLSDLTPNTISCNSSRTAEIVAHGLSFLIQKNVDLRNAFFPPTSWQRVQGVQEPMPAEAPRSSSCFEKAERGPDVIFDIWAQSRGHWCHVRPTSILASKNTRNSHSIRFPWSVAGFFWWSFPQTLREVPWSCHDVQVSRLDFFHWLSSARHQFSNVFWERYGKIFVNRRFWKFFGISTRGKTFGGPMWIMPIWKA